MIIGLKRGVVELVDHDPEWEKLAAQTIERLWRVFNSSSGGRIAEDIQHVGSTAIASIKAQPIIDIAVAVEDFAEVESLTTALEAEGFIHRNWNPNENEQMLYDVGYDVSPDDRITTHFIHIVRAGSITWTDYIDFRDYLNAIPDVAKEYESIKIRLAAKNLYDPCREKYLAGKHDFIVASQQTARIWADFGKRFTKIELVTKGLSDDKKYYIEDANARRMLLRVSDVKEYDYKKASYQMMERVYEIGVLTSQPFEFGLCNGNKSVYSLSGWLDGEDVETALPRMSETDQYALGLKAGETLRKIHALPSPDDAEPWSIRYFRRVQERLGFYESHHIKSEKGEILIKYLQENKYLLDNRPQTFIHSDYYTSNLMVMPDGQVGVVDFNYWCVTKDYGDPWCEFDAVHWGKEMAAHFYTGQVRGYFGGEPPCIFFLLLSYYHSYSALSALCDTLIDGQCRPAWWEGACRHTDNVLKWFDNMNNPVQTWYLKDFYIQWADGVPYKLKAPFDFSFLEKYGRVFKAFDDQDSGNICFGVTNPADGEDGVNKYFVKFAGAPTEHSLISAEEAVERIINTIPIYRDLAHPVLTKLINAEKIGGGFAMIFEWTDAECMGRQYPPSREKFMQMPLDTRLRVFDEILEFHAYVAEQGYVAIDFYDGCIMYDFKIGRLILCDVEFYSKAPYNNPIGRMWGSSRFMSPEEFELGAVIDEITNVYTMGATAFALFGDERDRSSEKWKLSKELFDVAKKAISDDRCERQQSIELFIEEWSVAK